MYWQYASNTSEIYGTALAPYFGWMILDMEMEKTLKKSAAKPCKRIRNSADAPVYRFGN
jgi:hypothetical protein